MSGPLVHLSRRKSLANPPRNQVIGPKKEKSPLLVEDRAGDTQVGEPLTARGRFHAPHRDRRRDLTPASGGRIKHSARGVPFAPLGVALHNLISSLLTRIAVSCRVLHGFYPITSACSGSSEQAPHRALGPLEGAETSPAAAAPSALRSKHRFAACVSRRTKVDGCVQPSGRALRRRPLVPDCGNLGAPKGPRWSRGDPAGVPQHRARPRTSAGTHGGTRISPWPIGRPSPMPTPSGSP
jgi:hypothetical protein